MPTGSGLWHFLYRLVRKFIRSVVAKKTWQLLAETGTGRHIITMHFGNGDKPNCVLRSPAVFRHTGQPSDRQTDSCPIRHADRQSVYAANKHNQQLPCSSTCHHPGGLRRWTASQLG